MISDIDFGKLLESVDRPWSGYRKVRKGVKKRIGRRMHGLGCSTMDEYLVLIDQRPDERLICKELLAVTISRFFRDRRLWDAMRERILPEMARRLPQGLSAWSAGCAGGEEPYSLALTWDFVKEHTGMSTALDILGSDLLEESLLRARRGIYPAGSLREVPDAVRSRYFRQRNGGRQIEIVPDIKAAVHWLQHDLVQDDPPGSFDLILLRNSLLTYYRGPALQSAFARLTEALRPNGILVVGAHEHPPSEAPLIRDLQCPWIYSKVR